ncbi:hypothetical protein FQZ97_1014030 [compost metagenome]
MAPYPGEQRGKRFSLVHHNKGRRDVFPRFGLLEDLTARRAEKRRAGMTDGLRAIAFVRGGFSPDAIANDFGLGHRVLFGQLRVECFQFSQRDLVADDGNQLVLGDFWGDSRDLGQYLQLYIAALNLLRRE